MEAQKTSLRDLSPLSAHIDSLRKAVIKSAAVIAIAATASFYFYEELFSILLSPYDAKKLLILSPIEGFSSALLLSFWLALFTTASFWGYFFFRFIEPALEKRELSAVKFTLSSLSMFGLFGGYISHAFALPLLNSYFLAFNAPLGINQWRLSEYLDFAISITLGTIAVFELAALFFSLIYFGVLKKEHLRAWRRPVIVAVFILSAILTPPDVASQLMMALPLLVLYEVGIWFAKSETSES